MRACKSQMPALAALLLMHAMSTAQGCYGNMLPGEFSSTTATAASNQKGACDRANKAKADGITYDGGLRWTLGKGSIQKKSGTWSCLRIGRMSNETRLRRRGKCSCVRAKKRVLSVKGVYLTGMEPQQRCQPEAHYRVIGPPLNFWNAQKSQEVTSTDECCELCHKTIGCGAWTIKMPLESTLDNPSPWLCSLAAKAHNLTRTPCTDGFSGCFSGMLPKQDLYA